MLTECFTLPSGATLEYSCAGDPQGYPLILHHGLIGSAHISPPWHEHGLKQQLRLIGIARPGYGQSTPQPMQQVGDWAALIAPLVAHLGLKQFDVLGISAGAPYALALGHGLPEQVSRIWLFSGVPPVFEPEVLAQYSEASQQAYQFYLSADHEAIRQQFQSWALAQQHSWETQHQANSPHMAQVWPSALAWECAGLAREAQLQIRPWGFEPRQLSQPIQLWHSRADDMVPFAAVEYYYQSHLRAKLHIQPEATHFPSSSTERAFFEALRNH